ncbi:MAG: SIR2 family protein [Anaerolineae bacterium]|nr:SIR2 family protein [Anaerolineae bacterium]
MALDLATRTSAKNPEQYSFPEAAQVFENEFGRNTLVQFVKDRLEALDDQPRSIHRLIAKLEVCHVLVTTGVDQRLEQAFAQIGRPLDVVVGNKEVPFVDDRKTQLYKLRGSIDRIESLVLTENDYETFFENQTSLSIVLQSYLARKTVLFVGYDLADPNFKQLYRKVTAPLDGYARRAYAFGAVPTNRVAHWCKYQGIEVIEVPATAFVEALTLQLSRFKARTQPPDRVRTPVPAEPVVRPLPDSPYKFLDFYDTGDEHIFFGRKVEKQQLTSLIHAHRLTLLYGASGTGKTSLLLAGVQPSLQKVEPSRCCICYGFR